MGQQKSATLSLQYPRDTSARNSTCPRPQLSRRERKKRELAAVRNLRFDTTAAIAFMDLNTFTRDGRLPRFFKKSFKQLHKKGTPNLVIDLRGNGGGSVTNSNLLTKYISKDRFTIADTLYALKRGSRLGQYQQNRFFELVVFSDHDAQKGGWLLSFPVF